MPDPPEVLYDIDGIPMAVLGHIPARAAFRLVWDEIADLFDWWWFPTPDAEDDAADRCIVRLSEYRATIQAIKPGWFVMGGSDPFDESRSGEFGEETWWPVSADHEGAVAYTELALR